MRTSSFCQISLVALAVCPVRSQAQSASKDTTEFRLLAVIRDSVPSLMKQMDIPGAVVAVVRGDRIVLNQGFGLAKVAERQPVDAERTVFRTASVSKVFTAMAALRLAAEGRLDLTANVAKWIPDVDLGATPELPVTVAQLLTHTAGLDERLTGYLDPVGEAPPALEELFSRDVPQRTRTPDNSPAYSNHGYALVGLIVERITKTPFDAYLRDSLFLPLDMRRTGFVMRPETDTAHALEYRATGEIRVQRSSAPYPAGNVGTTGGDMTRFLRTVLTHPQDTVMRLLLSPVLRYHPELGPMGYVFSVVRMSGRDVWIKGGASPSHSAVIAFVPELNVGIFVAVNRQEPTFWNRLLPQMIAALTTAPPVADATPAATLATLDGDYLWTRAPLGSFEKVLGLTTQIRVRSSGRDTIRVDGPLVGGVYRRTGALRFQRRDSIELGFRVNDHGTAVRAFTVESGQPTSFERIPIYRTTRFQLAALGAGTVLALAVGILTLKRKAPEEQQPAWACRAIYALPIMEIATVGSAILLAAQSERLYEGRTPSLYATMTLSTLTAAAALAQSAGSATLAGRARGSAAKATYVLGAGAGLAIAAFLSANNLVGFRF